MLWPYGLVEYKFYKKYLLNDLAEIAHLLPYDFCDVVMPEYFIQK